MRTRPSGVALLVRVCLIAAAVSWWALIANICTTPSQPELQTGRTIPFHCPGTTLAFITPLQRLLLYGLVPACLALVVADVLMKRRRSSS